MSKVKVKKQSTFIDMTAMSDVTVLLLTFFMLTATFLPKEPIKVTTPSSVMEIKIPEANLLTILVRPDGKCYMNLDRPNDKKEVLRIITEEGKFTLSDQQIKSFINQPTIGVPLKDLSSFLNKDLRGQDEELKTSGIPTDSTNNQLKYWIRASRKANPEIRIAIKADQGTPYTNVKNVIETLQELKENRFHLITTLKGMPAGF